MGTDGELPPPGGAPGVAETVSNRLDIDAALARLPLEFRTVVVLRDQLGMDYAAIAETLEIPVGTVRSRLARGRGALAALVGNRRGRPSVQEARPMTDPAPPPDDQLVSDHLDGVAEDPAAVPADDASRGRFERFAEARDLVAAEVPVPPDAQAAVAAALRVFDTEAALAAGGAGTGGIPAAALSPALDGDGLTRSTATPATSRRPAAPALVGGPAHRGGGLGAAGLASSPGCNGNSATRTRPAHPPRERPTSRVPRCHQPVPGRSVRSRVGPMRRRRARARSARRAHPSQ